MNETTERFLREIADRVGAERVTEIHLFPSVRQGATESGLAVVAAHPETTTPDGVQRHVVYTARYRATLKGPDRGKWDIDVTAEADAPLVTVDEVVRGVVRRSGDELHPERISGDQLRLLVPSPATAEVELVSSGPSDTPPPDNDPE
jgi:hypothetical protein